MMPWKHENWKTENIEMNERISPERLQRMARVEKKKFKYKKKRK